MGVKSLYSYEAQNRYVTDQNSNFGKHHGKSLKGFLKARGNGLAGTLVSPVSTVLAVGICGVAGVVFVAGGAIATVCTFKPKYALMGAAGGGAMVAIGGLAVVSGTVGTATKAVSIVSPELVTKGMKMHEFERWCEEKNEALRGDRF